MESRHLAVMMTDIQGFTKATSGMGRDEVDALLARHEELLLPVIEAHDGTVVKGLGDAFLVTFESPNQAVRAGIRIQEVLAEHNAAASDALQTFLKHHRQLAIAVDEFGSMSGVITMEDVIEHIIGQEIFEDDDPAIDMRELARKRQYAEKRRTRKGSA